MLYAFLVFAFSATLAAALWYAAKKGKYETLFKKQKETDKVVSRGLAAQDAVATDVSARDRVRDEYSN